MARDWLIALNLIKAITFVSDSASLDHNLQVLIKMGAVAINCIFQ